MLKNVKLNKPIVIAYLKNISTNLFIVKKCKQPAFYAGCLKESA